MQKEEDETIFYTHIKQALTNERMILKYNNKSEGSEEKDRLCMCCINTYT